MSANANFGCIILYFQFRRPGRPLWKFYPQFIFEPARELANMQPIDVRMYLNTDKLVQF